MVDVGGWWGGMVGSLIVGFDWILRQREVPTNPTQCVWGCSKADGVRFCRLRIAYRFCCWDAGLEYLDVQRPGLWLGYNQGYNPYKVAGWTHNQGWLPVASSGDANLQVYPPQVGWWWFLLRQMRMFSHWHFPIIENGWKQWLNDNYFLPAQQSLLVTIINQQPWSFMMVINSIN